VIGAIAGLGGAFVTNRATVRLQREERETARVLERERWEREDAHREQDRDRENHQRWLTDAREVAARLIRHLRTCERGFSGPRPGDDVSSVLSASGEVEQAAIELRLLAPDLWPTTKPVVDAVLEVAALQVKTAAGESGLMETLVTAKGDFAAKQGAFIRAAADLLAS
jgi:hypothetical protein